MIHRYLQLLLEKLWIFREMNESFVANSTIETEIFEPSNGSLIADILALDNASLPEVTTSICHFHETTENYIVVAVFLTIFLLSVVGNLLVIVVITNQRSMRSITNLYLMNLAVSDLMLSVICMPPTLVSMVTNCWLFGNILCKIFAYLQPMVVTASAYTLAVIAFERYFAICRPLHSRIWQTRSHAYAMITVVWAIAIIANLLLFFMYEERSYLTPSGMGITCTPLHPPKYHLAYQIYMTVVLCVVPLVMMAGLYGQVIRSLKTGLKAENVAENSDAGENSVEENNPTVEKKWTKLQRLQQKLSINHRPNKDHRKSEVSMAENPLRSTHNAKSAEAKQRVIKMLIVVVVIFFCCWTPSYIWWLLLMAGDSFESLGLNVWNPDLNTVITLMTYISSCTNPITYCFLNKKFRNAVYSMFGKKKILRHHFQKVYYPVTNTTHKVNDGRPAPINRSISTTSNPLRQQVASECRMVRSPSSQSSPNACLLRQTTLDAECL